MDGVYYLFKRVYYGTKWHKINGIYSFDTIRYCFFFLSLYVCYSKIRR